IAVSGKRDRTLGAIVEVNDERGIQWCWGGGYRRSGVADHRNVNGVVGYVTERKTSGIRSLNGNTLNGLQHARRTKNTESTSDRIALKRIGYTILCKKDIGRNSKQAKAWKWRKRKAATI